MSGLLINFAKDFTRTPGGRNQVEGPFSGEEFREKLLRPAIERYDSVVLELDGVFGFPSSFIDEAFGVLVDQIGLQTVRRKLILRLTDDPIGLKEINATMEEHGLVR